jgi:hypothetical protein
MELCQAEGTIGGDAERHYCRGFTRRVRAKLDGGISSPAISLLVCAYAQPNPGSGRPQDDGVYRLPVEAIPEDWRAACMLALDRVRQDDALADREKELSTE